MSILLKQKLCGLTDKVLVLCSGLLSSICYGVESHMHQGKMTTICIRCFIGFGIRILSILVTVNLCFRHFHHCDKTKEIKTFPSKAQCWSFKYVPIVEQYSWHIILSYKQIRCSLKPMGCFSWNWIGVKFWIQNDTLANKIFIVRDLLIYFFYASSTILLVNFSLFNPPLQSLA